MGTGTRQGCLRGMTWRATRWAWGPRGVARGNDLRGHLTVLLVSVQGEPGFRGPPVSRPYFPAMHMRVLCSEKHCPRLATGRHE